MMSNPRLISIHSIVKLLPDRLTSMDNDFVKLSKANVVNLHHSINNAILLDDIKFDVLAVTRKIEAADPYFNALLRNSVKLQTTADLIVTNLQVVDDNVDLALVALDEIKTELDEIKTELDSVKTIVEYTKTAVDNTKVDISDISSSIASNHTEVLNTLASIVETLNTINTNTTP